MLIQHLIVVRVSCSVSLPPKMPYRNTTHPPPLPAGHRRREKRYSPAHIRHIAALDSQQELLLLEQQRLW